MQISVALVCTNLLLCLHHQLDLLCTKLVEPVRAFMCYLRINLRPTKLSIKEFPEDFILPHEIKSLR